MPVVKPKKPPSPRRQATLGRAVGRADDFYALGYCPDLDELERETDPDHSAFTYILRYQQAKKVVVDRVKARLDGLWPPPQGPILAVGEPNGIVEIDPSGAREVPISPPPRGQLRSIWGPSDAHVFACGGYLSPFVLYRRRGQWLELPLPPEATMPYDVRGFDEQEVYFAGEKGQILLWDGRALHPLPVPTTRYLTALARLGDRVICVGGYQGTLLAGGKQGWRLVPTNTEEPLLALAELDGKVYYGALDVVWSFDGTSAPSVAIDTPARWLSGLDDGLVLEDGTQAKLYQGGKLIPLDTTV
jgi:hypothetical protein